MLACRLRHRGEEHQREEHEEERCRGCRCLHRCVASWFFLLIDGASWMSCEKSAMGQLYIYYPVTSSIWLLLEIKWIVVIIKLAKLWVSLARFDYCLKLSELLWWLLWLNQEVI
jgi:hypothetical protein